MFTTFATTFALALWYLFKAAQAAYAPIIAGIVATTPMTMPAISPFVRIGELFGAVLLGWTVVVECSVRTTSEGAVDVTRAAVWLDDELVDMNRGRAEPREVAPQYGQ